MTPEPAGNLIPETAERDCREAAERCTYRYRGTDRNGHGRYGTWADTKASLAVKVEQWYRQGWRELAVVTGDGPVPPREDEELQVAGIGRRAGERRRACWYETPGPAACCSDCGDALTVADLNGKRYCRVDAGHRLAAGEPVDYDDQPADGEPPRTETGCRGSGIYDCPCEADGPDGLCSCCRSGECNGSCAVPELAASKAGEEQAVAETGYRCPDCGWGDCAGDCCQPGPRASRPLSFAEEQADTINATGA